MRFTLRTRKLPSAFLASVLLSGLACENNTVTDPGPDGPLPVVSYDAGPDQTVNPGASVLLKARWLVDGAEWSGDPQEAGIAGPVTYQWSQLDGPSVALAGGDTPAADFTAPLSLTEPIILVFRAAALTADTEYVDDVRVTVADATTATNAKFLVANDVSSATETDVPVAITLTGADPEGSDITFEIVASPLYGSLSDVDNSPPGEAVVTYTPASGFEGADSFTFKARNGDATSNVAVAAINVHRRGRGNSPPKVYGVSGETGVEQAVVLTLAGTDADGDDLTFSVASAPLSGVLGIIDNTPRDTALVTYTPASGFLGTDSFTYRAHDGRNASNIGQVVITVARRTAVFDASAATVQADAVTLTLRGSDPGGRDLTFVIVSPPVNGSLGPLDNAPRDSAAVTYTPAEDFAGEDHFTFHATGGSSPSNLGRAVIRVYPRVEFALNPTEGPRDLTVTCTATTVSGHPLPEGTYTWTFDGTPESGPMSTHGTRTRVFRAGGRHGVTLSLTLAGISGPVACLNTQSRTTNGYATVRPLQITGNVRDSQGAGVSGVTVAANNGGTTGITDGSGAYRVNVPMNWTGVVTPQHSNYTFTPANRSYSNLVVDRATQDFTAASPTSNLPPVAVLIADPTSGPAPLTVNFDGRQSFDPEGGELTFEWDFGDGSDPVRGPSTVSHVYQVAGTYLVTLTVTDPHRLTGTDSERITAEPTSPPPPPPPSGPMIAGTVSLVPTVGARPKIGQVELDFTGTGAAAGQNFMVTTNVDGQYVLQVPSGWTGDITAGNPDRCILFPDVTSITTPVTEPLTGQDLQAWVPPIGIPMPPFGIREQAPPAPDPWNAAISGWYYVDNTHPSATDSSNPNGWPGRPRRTVPTSLPAGAVVEVHGGPYSRVSGTWSANGTQNRPVFIRGANTANRVIMGVEGNTDDLALEGSYLIVENLDIRGAEVEIAEASTSSTNPSGNHIVLRQNHIHHTGNTGSLVEAHGLNIVVYNNEISHADWRTNNAPEPSDDSGIAITDLNGLWILDNEFHDNSGDSVQTCHRCSAASTPLNIYVGRNHMHDETERSLGFKAHRGVFIASQNDMHNVNLRGGGGGHAIRIDDEVATPDLQGAIAIIFNRIYDSTAGIASYNSPAGTNGRLFIMGNVMHDLDVENRDGDPHEALSRDGGYVIGNSIYNVDRGITLGGTAASRDVVVNNVVWRNSICSICGTPSGSDEVHNNLITDPFFVNPAAHDYHLQSRSPAIDAGAIPQPALDAWQTHIGMPNGIPFPLVDFDTYPRPVDGNNSGTPEWDIGAYEFVPGGQQNQPPRVNAGPDQMITLPTNRINLHGTVSDDGRPNPPGAVTTLWTKESGPGTVTFGNAALVATTATFSAAGVYVLRLTADDFQLHSYDETTITVTAAPAPPAAPTGLTVSNPSSNSLTLLWTDNSTNEDGFRIEQRTGTGSFAEVGQVSANTTTYTAQNLSPSTTYYYRLRAYNSAGQHSAYSNEASGTTSQQPTAGNYEGYGVATQGADSCPTSPAIYRVANLNDSGPGSLRDALSQGCRKIVFDVGGTITLQTDLAIRHPYTTVDGSTAPSPGITIRPVRRTNAGYDGSFTIGGTHDIIINNIRYWGLWQQPGDPEPQNAGFGIDGDSAPDGAARRIILDHMAMRGVTDSGMDMWGEISDVTISWSLIYASPAPTTISFQDASQLRQRISLHHNVWANNLERNPQIRRAVHDFDYVNNVVYGWGDYGVRIRVDEITPSGLNILNNVFFPQGNPGAALIYGDAAGPSDDGGPPDCQPQGTVWVGSFMGDLWVSGNILPPQNCDHYSTIPAPVPIPSYAQVTTYSADQLCLLVAPHVGPQHKTAEEVSLLTSVQNALNCRP